MADPRPGAGHIQNLLVTEIEKVYIYFSPSYTYINDGDISKGHRNQLREFPVAKAGTM